MNNVLDVLVGTLRGLGSQKAGELGRDLRAQLNAKVASTDPTYDDDLVAVLDAFVEGFGDDKAGDVAE